MKHHVINLAFELCQIPSITNEEHEVVQFLSSWLKKEGFFVETIPVSDSRYNIFAYLEKKPKFTAVFCTHVDTVAPFIAPKIDENAEILWGRGACDAKGIASSMIYAVLEQKRLGFKDLALLFTVGEENTSDGAKACNEVLKDRSHYLVIGEPTELRAASAQKGTIVFDLIAQGREAHSSMPELGDSAVHKLVSAVDSLLKHSWPTDAHFGETLINVGEIHGGHARNMLANSALAKGILRASVPTSLLIEAVKTKLSDDIELVVKSKSDPFKYFVPAGFETFVAGFGSDAPYITNLGHSLLLGPGSLFYAHKEDEQIGFLELIDGVLAYQQIAHELRDTL